MGGVCLCVLGEGGSRRAHVGLMRDAFAALMVSQGAVCDKRELLRQQWWRCAAALGELVGQLAELVRVSQRLQHGVLALQHRVPLIQLLDLLFQNLHLLANSIHQMALHQVLGENTRKLKLAHRKTEVNGGVWPTSGFFFSPEGLLRCDLQTCADRTQIIFNYWKNLCTKIFWL